jgi:hypothetical protein
MSRAALRKLAVAAWFAGVPLQWLSDHQWCIDPESGDALARARERMGLTEQEMSCAMTELARRLELVDGRAQLLRDDA